MYSALSDKPLDSTNAGLIGYLLLVVILLLPFAAQAEITGFMAIEQSHYLQTPLLANQKQGSNPNLILTPSYRYHSSDKHHAINIKPYLRYDATDRAKSFIDLRELNYVYRQHPLELRLGWDQVFWGVTESRHLVDIINQFDLTSNHHGDEKFGQPMLQLATNSDYGTIRLFYLPYFIKPKFSSIPGREHDLAIINTGQSLFETSNKRWYPNFALRYEHSINDFDLGLAQFHGIDHEFVANFVSKSETPFIDLYPKFHLVDITTIDLQYTNENWLWKLEAKGCAGYSRYYAATVAGFEYTFYDVNDDGNDLGLLIELHQDGRPSDAPLSRYNSNIFAGLRYLANDIYGTNLLLGMQHSFETHNKIVTIKFSRRLTDQIKFSLDGTIISNVSTAKDVYWPFRRDSYLKAQLRYYF